MSRDYFHGERDGGRYVGQAAAAPAARLTGCQWFVLCDQVAAGIVVHPGLGGVPTCRRCAERLGLELVCSPSLAERVLDIAVGRAL